MKKRTVKSSQAQQPMVPAQEIPKIVLELTIPQVNTVLGCLREQPFKLVAEAISTIEQQAIAQVPTSPPVTE